MGHFSRSRLLFYGQPCFVQKSTVSNSAISKEISSFISELNDLPFEKKFKTACICLDNKFVYMITKSTGIFIKLDLFTMEDSKTANSSKFITGMDRNKLCIGVTSSQNQKPYQILLNNYTGIIPNENNQNILTLVQKTKLTNTKQLTPCTFREFPDKACILNTVTIPNNKLLVFTSDKRMTCLNQKTLDILFVSTKFSCTDLSIFNKIVEIDGVKVKNRSDSISSTDGRRNSNSSTNSESMHFSSFQPIYQLFQNCKSEMDINKQTGSGCYIAGKNGKILQRFLATKEIVVALEKTMIRPFQKHSRMIQDSDLPEKSNNSSSSFFGKKRKEIPGASHSAENALKLHYKRTRRV